MDYILGLDLGTTSVGWAIVECTSAGRPLRITNSNSRIFLSMVEADTKVPKNKKRREKRLMRRQGARYKQRRNELVGLLLSNQLLPTDIGEHTSWERNLNNLGHPIALRARAAEEKVSLFELGRIFLNLLRRRGYKSNRGAKFQLLMKELGNSFSLDEYDQPDTDSAVADVKKNETGLVLTGIRLMEEVRKAIGQRATLAQVLVEIAKRENHELRRPHTLTRNEVSKKGKTTAFHLHALREWYEEEFSVIWDFQQKYHPEILTNALRIAILQCLFFQRPLQSQKSKVGNCSLLLHKKRAAKALLEAQECRMLEDLNNLEYQLPRGESKKLNEDERRVILTAFSDTNMLNERGLFSWAAIKKHIGLPPKTKFNLERTSKSGLYGNRTQMALIRTMPEKWQSLGADKLTAESFSKSQLALVGDLVNIEDKLALFNRLTNKYSLSNERCPWRFSEAEAFALVTLELDNGYSKHCLKVMCDLLPHLRAGAIYPVALGLAGYMRKDQIDLKGLARLPEAPEIANPIVQKALYETRRVVNALIDKYGKPKIVRIEMARDMKASKAHREEMDKQNKVNQKRNEAAAMHLRDLNRTYPDLNIRINRESILRYKLLEEQKERCAYSSSEAPYISDRALFDGSTDVDHIYPLSLSGDDSYANKVLCFRRENMEKGQKTPWQAWGDSDKYQRIVERLEALSDYPHTKLRRIKDRNFKPNEDFIAAQLNDTRYICVAVRNYLAILGYDDQHLQVTRGQMTAEIRRLWGLSNILPKVTGFPTQEQIDTETGEVSATKDRDIEKKKDRGDHRHHAIDAIVTALIDKTVFANLLNRYRYRERTGSWPDTPLECDIDNLRTQTSDLVMANVVSHAANRKVDGALHDELPFGMGVYIESGVPIKEVLRKPGLIGCEPDGAAGKSLDDGSSWIEDDQIREALRNWVLAHGMKKITKDTAMPMLHADKPIAMVDIAHRCYVKRASVEVALEKIDNAPGKKTWIVDSHTRKVLSNWVNSGNKAKDARNNPPRITGRNSDATLAEVVKSVRLATNASGMVRFGDRPQIFAKNSNHHVVIFKKHLEDGNVERKGIFVDLLEAAKRRRHQPIIRRDTAQLLALDPSIDVSEWKFEFALCANDMVIWHADFVPSEQVQLGLPVYRLQKMSGINGTLVFRHFSVTSTSDTDRRGIIQASPNTIHCKKIRIDALGSYETIEID